MAVFSKMGSDDPNPKRQRGAVTAEFRAWVRKNPQVARALGSDCRWPRLLRAFDFFQTFGEVVAAFDFAAILEADEVGLTADVGLGGDFFDEVAGGFDFPASEVPFLTQEFGGGGKRAMTVKRW